MVDKKLNVLMKEFSETPKLSLLLSLICKSKFDSTDSQMIGHREDLSGL